MRRLALPSVPAIFAAAAMTAACGTAPAEEPAEEAEEPSELRTVVLGAAELAEGRVVIDLRDPTRWIVNGNPRELPLDRADLVLPDGTRELFSDWLARHDDFQSIELYEGDAFLLEPETRLPENLAELHDEECELDCAAVGDDAQLCTMPCDLLEYVGLFNAPEGDGLEPPPGHDQGGEVDPTDEDPATEEDGDCGTGDGRAGDDSGNSSGASSSGSSSSGSSSSEGGSSGGSSSGGGGNTGNPGW